MIRRPQLAGIAIAMLLTCEGCLATFTPDAPTGAPRVVFKKPLAEREQNLPSEIQAPDYLALARDLVAQHDPQYYDTAWVFLDKAEALPGEDPEGDYLRGVIKREKGEMEEARTYFEAAVDKSPTYAEAYHALGRLHGNDGELDTAMAYYRKALVIDPDRADFNNDMGFSLLLMGDAHGAEPYLRKSVAAAEPSEVAVNNLALCLGLNGNPEEALELLTRRYPPALAHNNMGVIYRAKGDAGKALAMFREALRLDPELTVAAGNLEDLLRENGKTGK